MSETTDKLASEIQRLPDVEKFRLVDAILTDLDRPVPEIDRVWAEETRKRGRPVKPVGYRPFQPKIVRLTQLTYHRLEAEAAIEVSATRHLK